MVVRPCHPRPSPTRCWRRRCRASGLSRRGRSRGRPSRARALREVFGFPAFRPGPARGGRGGGRRARRAGRDAHRLGQVALLPAAGADAGRPDAGRLAARLAHAGPGRGAGARRAGQGRAGQRAAGRGGEPRGGRPRGVRARRGCSTSRPSGSPRPASSSGSGTPRSACSWSTRRTASPSGATTSGPTTSGSPTRRAGSARRRSWPRRRRRRRRSPTTSSRGSGLRDPVRSRPGSTGRTSRSPSCRARPRRPGHRGIAAALARAGRAAGDRLRGHARGVRQAVGAAGAGARHGRCSPTTRGCRATRAPRRSGASWPARSTSSWRRTRSAWASTRPTCGRSATSRCPARSRRTTRRPAAPGATAQPARCLLFASARDKGLHVFFIERSTVEEPALKAVARALTGAAGGAAERAVAGTQATKFDVPVEQLARFAGCDEEVVRAIVGHLARIGVVQPSPSAPDRVLGRVSGRVGRPRARALQVGRAGGHARALAPVPRGVGVGRGRRRAGARASCATSATGRRPRRPARAATSAIRRSRPRCRGPRRRRRGGGGPRQLAQRPVAAGDDGGARRGDRRGRRARAAGARPHARRRGPARRPLEGAAQARLGRAARTTARSAT